MIEAILLTIIQLLLIGLIAETIVVVALILLVLKLSSK